MEATNEILEQVLNGLEVKPGDQLFGDAVLTPVTKRVFSPRGLVPAEAPTASPVDSGSGPSVQWASGGLPRREARRLFDRS